MWLNDLYHSLDPVAFAAGPLVIRWYGLAYIAGFIMTGVLMYRTSRRWRLGLTVDDVTNVMIGIALGVIIGARLGYCLFYGNGYYLAHPLKIFATYEGGMSFHGGLIGAILGGTIVAWRSGISIVTVCDLAVIGAPCGLFFGRCANFINGELWGKETTLPWGVMFDDAGGGLAYRHPTQLYEALLEGVVMLVVLYLLSRRARPQGSYIGAFLMMYGVFRFCIEFVRLPDEQLGYLLGTSWLTMGQCLSIPLVVVGAVVLLLARRLDRPQAGYLE